MWLNDLYCGAVLFFKSAPQNFVAINDRVQTTSLKPLQDPESLLAKRERETIVRTTRNNYAAVSRLRRRSFSGLLIGGWRRVL
jgi:hypothetical protein